MINLRKVPRQFPFTGRKKRRVKFEIVLIGEEQYKAHFIDADTGETIHTDLGWLVLSSSTRYPGSTFLLCTGGFETELPPATKDGPPIWGNEWIGERDEG